MSKNLSTAVLCTVISIAFMALLGLMMDDRPSTARGAINQIATEAPIRFGVIGDFGNASEDEAKVAALVTGWNPDFIVTLGDNNYQYGAADTIDTNIGQYYSAYIYPYTGHYTGTQGTGYGIGPRPLPVSRVSVATNRFFPALGNHDWESLTCAPGSQPSSCQGPYFDYFTLPGNERYYDFVQGPVHFFVIDSDAREPDGITALSAQATWLKNALAASTTPWQIVTLHHSPYSSALHGSDPDLQWPYQAWGADAVLSGHDHSYERLLIDGLPYFVNGLGGAVLYPFNTPIEGSVLRYSDKHGAMLVTASTLTITFQLIDITSQTIDTYTLPAGEEPTATPTAPAPTACGQIDIQITQGADDVEEDRADGSIYTNSTDLEMSRDPGNHEAQTIGLRFAQVMVPAGATITSAAIRFGVDEVDTVTTTLRIRTQAVDDAPLFDATPHAISNLPASQAAIVWENVAAWTIVGSVEQTPNLAAIVQEVVSRSDWRSGNALAFIIDGDGRRTAIAYEGGASGAARLCINYTMGQASYLPLIMDGQ